MTNQNAPTTSHRLRPTYSHPRQLRPILVVLLSLCFMALCGSTARAQFESGGVYDGSISVVGETNTWTFTANAGERVVLRRAQTSSTDNFAVRTRVFAPNGTLLDTSGIGGVDEHAFTATDTGTFTVQVSDGSGSQAGTGMYRFYFVKLPGSFTIPPGDDGGALPGSGEFQDGLIAGNGDLDLWTFPASTGERIVMRRAQLTGTNNFAVRTRVYDPTGVLLNTSGIGGVDEYAFTAASSGTFTVLVADGSGPLAGTGTYRFYFVKLPGSFTVPAGDEGVKWPTD